MSARPAAPTPTPAAPVISAHRRPRSAVAALAALGLGLLAACGSGEPSADAPPERLRAWAEARLSDQDYEGAIVGFRRALQQDSLDVAALVGLARVYELQERPTAADRYLKRAFHLHYDRYSAFMEADRPDSARAALSMALGVMPRHPVAHLRLGDLSLQAGQLDSAVVHYEHAVEADPEFVEALLSLAGGYREAGRADEARALFERALAVNINAVTAYLGLAEIYTERGDWAQVAAQYEKVLLIDPRSEVARGGLDRARDALRGR